VSLNLPSQFTRFGVDAQGNILIAANPSSCTLPTLKPLYGCGLIWIGKLDPSGHTLLFAIYLGNSPVAATALFTQTAGIAADPSGNLIVAAPTNFPSLTPSPLGAGDTFIARVRPSGTSGQREVWVGYLLVYVVEG
jgi:hypothetical protein